MTDTLTSANTCDSSELNGITQTQHSFIDFDDFTKQTLDCLHNDIQSLLQNTQLPTPLNAATRYVMMAGGKRVRPLLVASGYRTVKQAHQHIDNISEGALFLNAECRRSMLAVELLHAYSLVHDDLPCMDDDDLRRGKPTCHVKFGEGTALLAGDVLQTLAFEALMPQLSGFDAISSQQSAHLLSIFAPRARRMVMGQMQDVNAENMTITQTELETIHKDKTGALIEAAVLMGGACAGATAEQLQDLQQFATNIGLAFQVQDDILDVIKSTDDLGKPAGSDEKLNKSTYVKLMGVDKATHYAKSLFNSGTTHIKQTFGEDNRLIELSDWLWQRPS